MEQFIVYAVRYDNGAEYAEDHHEYIEKVFSTREKAEQYALEKRAEDKEVCEGDEYGSPWCSCTDTWTVEEMIVH